MLLPERSFSSGQIHLRFISLNEWEGKVIFSRIKPFMALLSIFPGVKKVCKFHLPPASCPGTPRARVLLGYFWGRRVGELGLRMRMCFSVPPGKIFGRTFCHPGPKCPWPRPSPALACHRFVALPRPQGVLLPYPWASSRFPRLALCQRDCSPLSPWGHMAGGAGSRPLSSYPHRPNSGPNSSGLILICLCTNLPTAPLICCTAGWAAYPPRFQPFSMCLLGCKKIALLSPPFLLISGTSWREPLPASWHRVRSQSTPPQQYHPGCPLSYTVEGGA